MSHAIQYLFHERGLQACNSVGLVAMRRNRAPRKTLAPGVLDVPIDLLSTILRGVGLKSAIASLPANSKLHQAWQAAVEYVDIDGNTLRDGDIKIINKLVNLEALRFHGTSSIEAVPVWRVAALVAPELSRLTKLVVSDVSGAFGVLKAITHAHGLSNQLRDLRIRDMAHKLRPDDLWAVVYMKELVSLHLFYDELGGSSQELSFISSKLTALKQLELDAEHAEHTAKDLLAAFPGQLTSLTLLILQSGFKGSNALEEQQLISATSALTNLQNLQTNFAPYSAAAQQQVIGKLAQLTYLSSVGPDNFPQLNVLSSLPDLKTLATSSYSVAAPFAHPALEVLEAGRLEVGEQWRGKTAEDCSIVEMTLSLWQVDDDAVSDASLQNMPLLPQLTKFCCAAAPSDGRYLQLAALLCRQGSKLRCVTIRASEPFEEALPQELPACTQLSLEGSAVSRHTLVALARCSVPALQELQLSMSLGSAGLAGLNVAADLAWLRGLPQLQVLKLSGVTGELAAAFKASVGVLLQGSRIDVRYTT